MAHTIVQSERRNGLFMASLLLGISLIVCTAIISRTAMKVKGLGRTITVTGAANQSITSNYAIWEGRITVTAPELKDAYPKIKIDREKMEAFLIGEGFATGLYHVGSVEIFKNYNRDREIINYSLQQRFKVEMADIDRITDLAQKSSTLLEQGVELSSGQPRYLFTGLDELKIEMIRAATENAKLRAEELARTTGQTVGAPTSARVGVFQIRALHSQEVSGRGMSDVYSIEKEIVSTVHISFLIE